MPLNNATQTHLAVLMSSFIIALSTTPAGAQEQTQPNTFRGTATALMPTNPINTCRAQAQVLYAPQPDAFQDPASVDHTATIMLVADGQVALP